MEKEDYLEMLLFCPEMLVYCMFCLGIRILHSVLMDPGFVTSPKASSDSVLSSVEKLP